MTKDLADLLYNQGVRNTREKYLKKMIKLRKKNQLLSLYARSLFNVLIKEFGTEESVYKMVTNNVPLDNDKEVRDAFNRLIKLLNSDAINIVDKESFKKVQKIVE